ncbi:MAG: hypothetical protein QXQ81_10450 [Candidatus Thorarchaeota archaeon]
MSRQTGVRDIIKSLRCGTLDRIDPVLLIVLVLAAVLWGVVFASAMTTFSGVRPLRGVWPGIGTLPVLGWTVGIDLEGYVDYDFYYITWAEKFLSGEFPYAESFDTAYINETQYSAPYFLPPLFLYLCTVGSLLPIYPFGAGAVITTFGFMTALPVYSISRYLSESRVVANVATITYLFNPLILYYTAFQWLNPAPFVFFAMLSFSLIMHDRRRASLLSMLTSMFFKQIAVFLLLPLIAYLVKERPSRTSTGDEREYTTVGNDTDVKSFSRMVSTGLIYCVVLSLPHILRPIDYFYYLLQRPGVFILTQFDYPPSRREPITLAVLCIVAGLPDWLSMIVNFLCYSTLGILVTVLPLFALMLVERKDDRRLRYYWRRMFYYSLLLLICVHLFSPRGVYKYYFVAIVPFLCILSAGSLFSRDTIRVVPRGRMIVLPFLWSILILLPDRNIYLLWVILMLVSYVLGPKIHHSFVQRYRTRPRNSDEGLSG